MLPSHNGPRVHRLRASTTAQPQIRAARSIVEEQTERLQPLTIVALGDDDPGVADHVWNLAAVRGEDRHAARERLDQHPSELLAPLRCRLTRRAQHIHRVEVRRHLVVRDGRMDADAVAVLPAPRASVGLERTGAEEEGAPRHMQTVQRRHQARDSFFLDEAADESHDRNVVVPAELLSNPIARGRVPPEMIDVDARRNGARPSRPSALVEHRARRLAVRDHAVSPSERVALHPPERRRIALRDVLKRRVHERNARGGRVRDLRRRGDVRFLPHVHEIP